MDARAATSILALDWGTSSLRAFRLDAAGRVLERRASADGILAAEGAFETVLAAAIGDWLEAHPGAPVVLSGMVGSRQGWVEVPYVPCPADAAAIAAGVVAHATTGGRALHFLPGLSTVAGDGVPDVMRGEETQIAGSGALDADAATVVLPGTHSKWARVAGGRIEAFSTFMTGEVYAVLVRHSILGRLAEGDADDPRAFERGLDYAGDGRAGGLLGRLFSARSLALLGRLPATGVASYLSGLLVGTEIREGLARHRAHAARRPARSAANAVIVAGEAALAARYVCALARLGVDARAAPGDAAARGLWRIAGAAGLVEARG